MKKLLIAGLMLLSTSAIAAPLSAGPFPVDLSQRDKMLQAIASLIIATGPECFGFRWAVNNAPADKMDSFARLYGHQVDARWTKDVVGQFGKIFHFMGKSVENWNAVCHDGYLVSVKIREIVR